MNDKDHAPWVSPQVFMMWASDELDNAVGDGDWARVELVIREIDAELETGESEMNNGSSGVNGTIIALAVLAVILILGLCGMLTLLMLSTDVDSAMLLAQMVV